MLYLDEDTVEDLAAEATLGAECPFHYPALRAAWWRGQKERSVALKMLNRCTAAEAANERMM